MLLRIATEYRPATDLGYLLHKHPERLQRFDLAFGAAHVFYPEASESRCELAMALDVDPIALARARRGRGGDAGGLGQYVNDRPYVSSSFLSVAIARVLGSALAGKSRERPDLARAELPLEIHLSAVPSRGGSELVHGLFAPLGYEVEARGTPLDSSFPDWGESRYQTIRLEGRVRLSDALRHIYVLVPVLDDFKHYWVGEDEIGKLVAKGTGWLESHPMKEAIARRYLSHRRSLTARALDQLVDEEDPDAEARDERSADEEARLERPIRLHVQRHEAVLAELERLGAGSVLDLGCGDGRLLAKLVKNRALSRITGADVSVRALESAARRLRLEERAPLLRERLELIHASALYRDARFSGHDAIVAVEVVEHLDPSRLKTFERVVFEFARPRWVIVTTPNREYNELFGTLPAGRLRHADHRFEWTREEFRAWAAGAESRGYTFVQQPVGDVHERLGAPSQMGVFERDD